MAADDADQAKILAESKRLAALYAGGSTRGAIALRFALNQVGDIYVWGGAGPTKWDCSGLTTRESITLESSCLQNGQFNP